MYNIGSIMLQVSCGKNILVSISLQESVYKYQVASIKMYHVSKDGPIHLESILTAQVVRISL